ncbi:MAG: WbqC family protein [Patescibacteria group bacterium]
MILTAHQPAYLPWLGLFHKIALSDKFIFFDQVQYQPKSFSNRNSIKTNQGKLLLTVPVFTKGYRDKKFSEIAINNALPWKRKHWRAIEVNYAKAPCFKAYSDFFEDVYKKEWEYLADLNLYMLTWLLETLGIAVPIERARDYAFGGHGSDLVLDMCVQLGADVYIFGEKGKDYANIQSFQHAGVCPVFQSYSHPVYRQEFGPFASHLSIIDLLFNEGSRSLEILMSNNITREQMLLAVG